MPNFTIGLNTTRGIDSILYGSDPHNFVYSGSTAPILRVQAPGDTQKNYVPIGTPVISTTNTTNDTITWTPPSGTILRLVVTAGADAYRLSWNIHFAAQPIDWDFKPFTYSFEGNPSSDGINAWSGVANIGWDIDAVLGIAFKDMGQTVNPWHVWAADLKPINFHFSTSGAPVTRADVYFSAEASQPGVYSEFPVAPSVDYNWDMVVSVAATQQAITTAQPQAATIQSARWPMSVNQTKFPTRSGFGLNFFCADGMHYAANPNGWNNDPNMALYNADGTLQASTGSYTGLNALWNFISGRTLWCNHVTSNAGGIGVIHWDLWWGGRYPQPGVDYIGDPTVSQQLVPEIWYSDANFTPNIATRWLNSAMQYAYNGQNPPINLGSSWMVGAALRGSLFHLGPPAYQSTYPDLQTGINDLTAKINFLVAAPYNHTVFYIDSFGPYNTPPSAYQVALLRQLMVTFPDVLLIPEAYGRADCFSCSYPFRDRSPTRDIYTGAGTTPQAPAIWPTAACACRFENGGNINMSPASPLYPNAIALAKQAYNKGGAAGDCPIATCYSGNPTEFEQIMALYKAIKNDTIMPSITSITPNTGPIAGGTSVSISGYGFWGSGSSSVITDVLFGTVPASSFTVNSDTSITAAAPAEGAATVDIRVKAESVAVSADQFTFKPPPTVTSISPTSGTASGGTTVTVTGTGFTGATSVAFGGTNGTSLSVTNDTTLTIVSPAESTGTVDVKVITPYGTSAAVTGDQFQFIFPAVTSVSPAVGSTLGGTTVTVTGSGFTGATSVAFGAANGTSLSVASDTSLSIVSPAESAGAVDVKVTTPMGTSPAVSGDQFAYKSTSFVQGGNALSGATTTTTCSFGAATTAGNSIIMSIIWAATTGSVSAISDGTSNVYTRILSAVDADSTGEIWYCSNAASATTLTITTTTAIGHRAVVAEYTGAVSIANSTSATGSSTAPATSSISTPNADDTLVGFLRCNANVRTAQQAGYTDRQNNGLALFLSDQQVNASGSYTYSATVSSGNWICALVILHPV